MKKKNIISISAALVAVLGITPALAACSGDHYDKLEFPAQDTSYVVTSQGGNAVGYGNYVYFINGTRGYSDSDGTNNVWGEVVKGGLYRAEFNGSKTSGKDYSTFDIKLDENNMTFKYTESTDYFDEPLNVVNVTAIAPKTIGTSGYSGGGIFIYDNFVYFASPVNQKSSTGTVQVNRTDFFMMPLSGGKPTKIYTTADGVNTSSSAYAFYKYGGSVYLVAQEESKIVTVRVDTAKQKADKPVEYNEGVTSVYFPVRDTYYKGIDTNTTEDFIYFVRSVRDEPTELQSGTVIEAMRPDGSEKFIVSMNGNNESIVAVRDGIMFYNTSDVQGKAVLAYDSLHDALMEKSATYKAAQDKLDDGEKNRQISGTFNVSTSGLSSIYPFRPDRNSNEVYFLASASSAINLYRTDGTISSVVSATGSVYTVTDTHVYYSGSSSDYYRAPLWEHLDGYGTVQTLASGTNSATFGCDYVNGFFTYYGTVDEWANGYMFFYLVDGQEGVEPQFVGKRASSDIPSKDEIKAAQGIID
ncbi:MAG: hypothetical protein J1F39_05495 [Clostridiales bacterium]|nr:hypothetical protein [Clostridiales bacterium]